MNMSSYERDDPLFRKRIQRHLYDKRGTDVWIASRPFQPSEVEGRFVIDLESARQLYLDDGSPLDKFRHALVNLAGAASSVGHVFSSAVDRWLVPTMDDEEACDIVEGLVGEGYAKGATASEGVWQVKLTPAGFGHAQELRGATQPTAQRPVVQAKAGETKVFISHSHEDESFAERLAGDLHRSEVDVWYDGWDLDIGHDLTVKIQEGISDSDFLAVILSPAAVKSPWVEKEWTTAFDKELQERRVVVLPILYQDCVLPVFLRTKKWADFREPDAYQPELANLIRCVRGESKRPSR